MRVLMCRPDYYGVQYEINPWMSLDQQVNHTLALKQWDKLYETIKYCGAKVDLVEPVDGWPDMVFTANAGMVYQNRIVLAHFKYKERQGEVPHFKNWFMNAGFDVINQADSNTPFFEGAGDALSAGKYLFAGFGFRSEKRFYEEASYLDQNMLVYCELIDPYFYHLDTCFCPISDELAIWYPSAFTPDSQKYMSEKIQLIAVNEDEAKRFACNAVVLGNNIVLPTGCPEVTKELHKYSYAVYSCDMQEYLKAGGACKCLTLRLD